MTWAQRVRTASTGVGGPQHSPASEIIDGGNGSFAAMNSNLTSPLVPALRPAPNSTSSLLPLDVAMWVEIFRFLRFRDVCAAGSTCRGLWSLHLTDWIWRCQELYLKRDLALARGEMTEVDAALALDTPPPPPPRRGPPQQQLPQSPLQGYRSFKKLKVQAARDLRREWDIRELVTRQFSDIRDQHVYADHQDLQREGIMSRAVATSAPQRILKSDLRIYDVSRPSSGPLHPSHILTACDDLAANVDGRWGLLDTTDAQDDGTVVIKLLVGLSATQAGTNMLHLLGPRIRLIELTYEEAHLFNDQELVTRSPQYREVLSEFVIEPADTRFFTGPELCNGRKVGLVVMDSLRILVFVCYDRD